MPTFQKMANAHAAGRINLIAASLTFDSSEAVVLERISEAATAFGGRSVCFISIAPNDTAHGSCRTLYQCGPAMAHVFDDAGLLMRCPWVRHAATSAWPVCGSEVPMSVESDQDFYESARRAGFCSTLIAPAPTPTRERRIAVLVFGSPAGGFFEQEHGQRLAAPACGFSMAVNRWLSASLAANLRRVCSLSEDELDLMRCEQRGMSSKEIARWTSNSADAVDCRFQRVCAKLRTPNRREALRVALSYGYLRELS